MRDGWAVAYNFLLGAYMKSREDAARFLEKQMNYEHECSRPKNRRHHYGWQEARELLDFIYEGKPKSESEMAINKRPEKY